MDMEFGSERTMMGFRRYGVRRRRINRRGLRLIRDAVAALMASVFLSMPAAAAAPTTILAFGDSLFAGFGLPASDSIVARLEAALKADGHDVRIVNASVSGDTTADGLARLDWSLADKPDLVLLELGANDALRGLDPAITRRNLDAILSRLQAAHIPVVIFGMLAPRNLGPAYAAQFEPIYPELAKKYQAPLYPFILDGVATDAALNQADGLHPNPRGVAIVVNKIAPIVERSLPGGPPT
jgi:acyl-CoA thioesterase-1